MPTLKRLPQPVEGKSDAASLGRISSFLAVSLSGDLILLIFYRYFHCRKPLFKEPCKDRHYRLLNKMMAFAHCIWDIRVRREQGGGESLYSDFRYLWQEGLLQVGCSPSLLSQQSRQRKAPGQIWEAVEVNSKSASPLWITKSSPRKKKMNVGKRLRFYFSLLSSTLLTSLLGSHPLLSPQHGSQASDHVWATADSRGEDLCFWHPSWSHRDSFLLQPSDV